MISQKGPLSFKNFSKNVIEPDVLLQTMLQQQRKNVEKSVLTSANERTWYFRLQLEVLLKKNSTFQIIIIDNRMRFFHDITELWVEFMLFNSDQGGVLNKTFLGILL